MNVPFFGTKIISDIDLDDIYALIDTHALFVGQWQFRRSKGSDEAYRELIDKHAWPAFEEWKRRCRVEHLLEPKIAYGFFKPSEVAKITGCDPAYLKGPIIPLQLVTTGSKVAEKCNWLFAAHQYTDYLYLHGIAVAATEALAEYSHRQILRELHVPFNAGKKLPTGSRISPGYPVWPDLSDQKELCRLLGAEKIGVSLTESYQLVPEYSTSALVTC